MNNTKQIKEALERMSNNYEVIQGAYVINKTTLDNFIEQIEVIEQREYKEMVDLLQWLTDEDSKYSIMYGGTEGLRFSCNETEYTCEQIIEIFKKENGLEG